MLTDSPKYSLCQSTTKFVDYSSKNYKVLPMLIESETDVEELRARHNFIKQVPQWISKLVNLTDLSIFDNCLTTLPDEIGLLSNLKSLDAGKNYLQELPKTLRNLKQLHFLSVENNCLVEIPEEIGYLKQLIVLQLSDNRIRRIPFTIVFCKSLFALHLEKNYLHSVPNNLAFLPNIEFLTVCNNKLMYLPSMPFTRKVHLDFSNNAYVNYVSFKFYEQQVLCNVCDRWFCHKNHENIMAFRKGMKAFNTNCLRNKVLEIKIENRKKRIIMSNMYFNIHKTEDGHFPTLFELSLRVKFVTTNLKELFDMYYCVNGRAPSMPTFLLRTLIRGPISKCQYCNNFIFTESVIWIVPKIMHCIICIKMDIPVVTIINFCSSVCALLYSISESSKDISNNLTALRIPWKIIN